MPEVFHAVAHFTGHVQGVGFRYSTLQVAKEFDVTGFVSNLPDGRVCVEAEGTSDQVKQFVAAVQERLHGYIRKTEMKTTSRPAVFQGFTIK